MKQLTIQLNEKTKTEKTDPFYNPANMRWLDESIQQGLKGQYIVKTMDELERMADE